MRNHNTCFCGEKYHSFSVEKSVLTVAMLADQILFAHFYGSVNTVKVMSSWSELSNFFLGRLL